LIVLDCAIEPVIGNCLDIATRNPGDQKGEPFLQSTTHAVSGSDSFQPEADCEIHKVYQDFSGRRGRLRKSILYFFAQSSLVLYYCFELNSTHKDNKTHKIENVRMMQWVVAVVIFAIAGDKECGTRFELAWWHHLYLRFSSQMGFSSWEQISFGVEFVLRFMADVFINGFCRIMILGTAPIMLCVEGHMDFVKDVTAIFFIFQLDDFDDPIKISIDGPTMTYVEMDS